MKMTPGEWVPDAKCRQMDPDFFFPGDTMSKQEAAVHNEAAKQFCHDGCPVRESCLEFALSTNQKEGVWGGTTPNDRRKIRRARALARRESA